MERLVFTLFVSLSGCLVVSAVRTGRERSGRPQKDPVTICEETFVKPYRQVVDNQGTIHFDWDILSILDERQLCVDISELALCIEDATNQMYWHYRDRLSRDTVFTRNLKKIAPRCFEFRNYGSSRPNEIIDFKRLYSLTRNCNDKTLALYPRNVEQMREELLKEFHGCTLDIERQSCLEDGLETYMREHPANRMSRMTLVKIINLVNPHFYPEVLRMCKILYEAAKFYKATQDAIEFCEVKFYRQNETDNKGRRDGKWICGPFNSLVSCLVDGATRLADQNFNYERVREVLLVRVLGGDLQRYVVECKAYGTGSLTACWKHQVCGHPSYIAMLSVNQLSKDCQNGRGTNFDFCWHRYGDLCQEETFDYERALETTVTSRQCELNKYAQDALNRAQESPCLMRFNKWGDLQATLDDCDGTFQRSMARFHWKAAANESISLCRILHSYSICRNSAVVQYCGLDFGWYHYQISGIEDDLRFGRKCPRPNKFRLHYEVDCHSLKACKTNIQRFSPGRLLFNKQDVKEYCQKRRRFRKCWTIHRYQCRSYLYRKPITTELRFMKKLCSKKAVAVTDSVTLEEPIVSEMLRQCEKALIRNSGPFQWKRKLNQKPWGEDLCELLEAIVLCLVEAVYSIPGSRPSLPRLMEHVLRTTLKGRLRHLAAMCLDIDGPDSRYAVYETVEQLTAKLDRRNKDLQDARRGRLQPTICTRGNDLDTISKRYLVTYHKDLKKYFWCDKWTQDGGWIVIQRRYRQDADFNLTWSEYRSGFGDLTGDFWIGNEAIHKLAFRFRGNLDLRIDIKSGGKNYFAVYRNAILYGNATNYLISFFEVTGSLGYHEGGFSSTDRTSFSTYDQNNNEHASRNCAKELGGGWWFKNCGSSNLNGPWREQRIKQAWRLSPEDEWMDAISTEMKIRPSKEACEEQRICGWAQRSTGK